MATMLEGALVTKLKKNATSLSRPSIIFFIPIFLIKKIFFNFS